MDWDFFLFLVQAIVPREEFPLEDTNMMHEKAMMRNWTQEWMEEVKKSIVETEVTIPVEFWTLPIIEESPALPPEEE